MERSRVVAVVGAGTMGSGIAHAFASKGWTVHLSDSKVELALQGKERIRRVLESRVREGKSTPQEAEALLGRIVPFDSTDSAVREARIVVEAVFEDLKVKQEVFREISAHAPEDAILATNTSSLSVSEIAESSKNPERVAGLHFFYPAAVNKLVEVVPGRRTSPETFQRLWDVSWEIGKIPIRSEDSPGFVVNRFFVPWLNESVRIVEEGVATIPTVEEVARETFGVTLGPFALMNATGIPIAYHAMSSLHRHFGEPYRPSDLLKAQAESGELWDCEGVADPSKFEEVQRRLWGVVFALSSTLVEEGVARPLEIDRGAIVGLRWSCGPLQKMNEMGTRRALELLSSLSQNRYPIPSLLSEMGVRDEPFDLRLVRLERRGAVALLFLDRPEALNALDERLLGDLERALEEVERMEGVRVVVLSGTGRAFASGADIKTMVEKDPWSAREYTLQGQRVLKRVEDLPLPVIASVEGLALGGGLELALSCDLILVGENALLGFPEVTLGIHPGFGGTQRLPERVGIPKAKELVFTGRRFTGKEGEQMGLALQALPDGKVLRGALDLAETIARNAPRALELAKAALNASRDLPKEEGLRFEADSVSLLFSTKDQKGAMRSFLERKRYEFEGK